MVAFPYEPVHVTVGDEPTHCPVGHPRHGRRGGWLVDRWVIVPQRQPAFVRDGGSDHGGVAACDAASGSDMPTRGRRRSGNARTAAVLKVFSDGRPCKHKTCRQRPDSGLDELPDEVGRLE
ncbi:hypothetical protein Vau01_116280 [Virgisporangium aurantiacum]|uniref:Uncharacterized protein n=1 Tax=Virgisporangium aurantiacum TaxID=175570 RepID=A0A8J3ZHA3_9ACTN|nr:hypothetical protein Vau01_116280 [Virgisporangium aurantiacum]